MSYNVLGRDMFVLGHIGIGSELVGLTLRGLDRPKRLFKVICLGCIAPDLIDKPLYYGWGLLQVSKPVWIAGTRTIGHTLLLWGLASLGFFLTKTKNSRMLFIGFLLGVLTHLIFDNVLDLLFHDGNLNELLWPAISEQFTKFPFQNGMDHLSKRGLSPEILLSEIVGGVLLWKKIKQDAAAD